MSDDTSMSASVRRSLRLLAARVVSARGRWPSDIVERIAESLASVAPDGFTVSARGSTFLLRTPRQTASFGSSSLVRTDRALVELATSALRHLQEAVAAESGAPWPTAPDSPYYGEPAQAAVADGSLRMWYGRAGHPPVLVLPDVRLG